ncbi:HNH endonuclease signature motif containing protein [Hymenobacter sp. DG01]|uniref:HNH endonuclease signature motif containing protein n=1 Tax=Hymenobacter sp. DG01 TaxID=2584940 RepID=UPI00112109FF|nr:HNH endonuclease signature motif containing protein [Hymenobacter sp. DG01]
MDNKHYEKPRPIIPAETRRAIEVESGYSCAVKNCGEHTYLEIHHIDENRENNKLENLILLCDKHHKMAHAKVIDRKSLQEYKKLLVNSYNSILIERFNQLEKLIKEDKINQPIPQPSVIQPVDENVKKLVPDRYEILNFCLCHIAIAHYEKKNQVYFEHQVEFVRGNDRLLLDALRQDDDLPEDIIIEFQYLRKSYQDATVYGSWVDKKVEIYEMLTGRKAKGILLVVVGYKRMIGDRYLEYTRKGVEKLASNVSLVVYSCEEVGFHPGNISASLFASNLK